MPRRKGRKELAYPSGTYRNVMEWKIKSDGTFKEESKKCVTVCGYLTLITSTSSITPILRP